MDLSRLRPSCAGLHTRTCGFVAALRRASVRLRTHAAFTRVACCRLHLLMRPPLCAWSCDSLFFSCRGANSLLWPVICCWWPALFWLATEEVFLSVYLLRKATLLLRKVLCSSEWCWCSACCYSVHCSAEWCCCSVPIWRLLQISKQRNRRVCSVWISE